MNNGGAPLSTLERELLETGIYASVTSGTSMQPLFRTHRDVVVLERPKGEIHRYDVVLYKAADTGKYILHRVLRVRDNLYVVRGDNTYIKEYVPRGEILGVLVSFTRKGKKRTVKSFGYILYSRLWCFIYPLRLSFVFLRRRVLSALSFIKRKLWGKGRNG